MKSRRRPAWPDLLTVLELPGDDVVAIERQWRISLERRGRERAAHRMRRLGTNVRERRWGAVARWLIKGLATVAVVVSAAWCLWQVDWSHPGRRVPLLVMVIGAPSAALVAAWTERTQLVKRSAYFTGAVRGRRYGRGGERMARMRAAWRAASVNEKSGRRRFWTLERPTHLNRGSHINASTPFVAEFLRMGVHMGPGIVMVVVVLQLAGIVALSAGVWRAVPAMIVAWGVAFMFTPAIAPHALRRFVERRVRAGRCGNCGYGVSGLPDQDPDGSMPGPARCPECACRWPLVLPPTPRRATATRT